MVVIALPTQNDLKKKSFIVLHWIEVMMSIVIIGSIIVVIFSSLFVVYCFCGIWCVVFVSSGWKKLNFNSKTDKIKQAHIKSTHNPWNSWMMDLSMTFIFVVRWLLKRWNACDALCFRRLSWRKLALVLFTRWLKMILRKKRISMFEDIHLCVLKLIR